MKNEIIIICLVLLAILSGMYIGLNLSKSDMQTNEACIVSFESNKDRYADGETAHFGALIHSPVEKEVIVRIEGIKSKYNITYVSQEKTVLLMAGANMVNFSSNLPYCNTCAGLSPGYYTLTLQIEENGTILDSSMKEIYLGR